MKVNAMNNLVKKHMDKLHKPSTHQSKKAKINLLRKAKHKKDLRQYM